MVDNRLGRPEATSIVIQCCPTKNLKLYNTLEEVGLISENLRLIFRECVFNAVINAGYELARADIPSDADTKLQDVIEEILASARPPGDPTTEPPRPRKRRQ